MFLYWFINIVELGCDLFEVLFFSLLWIDGWNLELYLLLFILFLVFVEYWFGYLCWFIVGLIVYIGVIYLSEGLFYLVI